MVALPSPVRCRNAAAASAARPWSSLACVLATCSVLHGTEPALARLPVSDTVVRVLDANSVKLERTGVVQLGGIVVPPRLPACFPYSPARALRLNLPANTRVDAEVIDRNGRAEAYVVRTRDRVLVNEALARGGWAQARKRAGPYEDQLRRAQELAQAEGVGLWQACDGPPAEDFVAEFEPLGGGGFEYGRSGPTAVAATPATPAAPPEKPSGTKRCSDFRDFEEAKRWYDAFYPQYGDVSLLDSDGDGVPCDGLPHTRKRELYQPKMPKPNR